MPPRGPAPQEWLLWAQEFQIKQKRSVDDFNSKIQSTTKNFNDKTNAIGDKTDNVTSLLISRTDATNNHVSRLEEETKDLIASGNHLQQENNLLKGRVQNLERDLSNLDRSTSEERIRDRERIDSAYSRLKHMRDAAMVLDDWKKEASTESKRRDKEADELKAMIERLSAGQRRVQAAPRSKPCRTRVLLD